MQIFTSTCADDMTEFLQNHAKVECRYCNILLKDTDMRFFARYGYVEKRHWHEHINFFTPEALARLLERADLRVLDSCILGVDYAGSRRTIIGAACRLPK